MALAAEKAAKTRTGAWIVIAPAGCFLVFVMPAFFFLFLFGLAPAWVATLADRGKGRSRLTVLLNLAGLIPFAARLWAADGSLAELSLMARDVYVWLAIYGAAGASTLLRWLGPQAAAFWLELRSLRETHNLERQKLALYEEWGAGLDAIQPSSQEEG